MPPFADSASFWGLLALQVVGFVSMILARMPSESAVHAVSRTLFFLCLMGTGAGTMYAIGCQSTAWVWLGTTFSLLAVGGSADLGASAAEGF